MNSNMNAIDICMGGGGRFDRKNEQKKMVMFNIKLIIRALTRYAYTIHSRPRTASSARVRVISF